MSLTYFLNDLEMVPVAPIITGIIIIIIIIITYCIWVYHSMAVVLTLVQTKQVRINVHKRNTTKTQYKQYETQ